ncbi:hypothetical protein [Streptomyces poriferorum]|nr:hypothetical protein [Streptomyces poriferorum]
MFAYRVRLNARIPFINGDVAAVVGSLAPGTGPELVTGRRAVVN